jgi:hypothetical protein
VEQDEMKINCGLQDRVVQAYEGLVYMDFAQKLLKGRGYGAYERLNASVLPKDLFFLAFSMEPSDSGVIHSTVKERWNGGDKYVVNAMKSFAGFANGESRERTKYKRPHDPCLVGGIPRQNLHVTTHLERTERNMLTMEPLMQNHNKNQKN